MRFRRFNINTLNSTRLCLCIAMILVCVTGCQSNLPSQSKQPLDSLVDTFSDRWMPSNDRDWAPEMAVLPQAIVNGSQYTLRNIRNCQYLSADDFVVNHYDRTIDISQIQTVDFVVAPFNETAALAHTMLSFGLDDGSYIGMSVEVRKERNEKYSPILGLGRKFELMYVLADERDLIRLRTRHRQADVYLYPTVANSHQAQLLFAQMMDRMNRLAFEPEFYNSITNNCTTNLKDHVNQLAPNRVGFNWRILLPGFSARYAYDRGLLDQRIPYEDLTRVAHATEMAEKYHDAPNFSNKIRSNRHLIDRYATRQFSRQPELNGRGDQFQQSIGTSNSRIKFR
jgi:hypothetical protein